MEYTIFISDVVFETMGVPQWKYQHCRCDETKLIVRLQERSTRVMNFKMAVPMLDIKLKMLKKN